MDPIRTKAERKEGGLIAQGLDNPAVIVTGASMAGIRRSLKSAIAGYVRAFPEDGKEFFKGGRMRSVALFEA